MDELLHIRHILKSCSTPLNHFCHSFCSFYEFTVNFHILPRKNIARLYELLTYSALRSSSPLRILDDNIRISKRPLSQFIDEIIGMSCKGGGEIPPCHSFCLVEKRSHFPALISSKCCQRHFGSIFKIDCIHFTFSVLSSEYYFLPFFRQFFIKIHFHIFFDM